MRSDELVDIFVAIVIGELRTCLDRPYRFDEDTSAGLDRLTVRCAGMVDVPGEVASWRAVDGPLAIDLEEVPRSPHGICDRGWYQIANILDIFARFDRGARK